MDASEFSNQFDLLMNSFSSNQAAGLNEYEKSVFLTKAQNELLLNRFDKDSQGNTVKKGFDESAVRQMNFANLMKTEKESPVTYKEGEAPDKIDPRSLLYAMPDDVFIVVNETMLLEKTDKNKTTRTGNRQVVPIVFDEYMRLMSKPFKEPLKWQAWRLINSASGNGNVCEIVLNSHDKGFYGEQSYVVRYIKKPKPIILADFSETLGENLSIDGETGANTTLYPKDGNGNITNPCELDSSTHEAILQRAVELAKVALEGDVNQTQLHVTAGQRSE